ncbi:MAG TPA: RecX family transcriptional regulator [Candidatus Kryptonia bacterium]
MRIASIERSGQGGKFKLVFEDGSAFVVRKEVLVDFGLRRNDDLSSEQIGRIQDAQNFTEGYLSAVRLLNYRMRTASELSGRLRKKGFQQEVIVRVLDKLGSFGLLDDSRFAEAFVATKTASKPLGRRELERRLREKGVSKELAAAAVAGIGTDERQFELACEAARSRMRSMQSLDLSKRRERLAAFLARRGFEWNTISKVLRKILKDDDDAVDI